MDGRFSLHLTSGDFFRPFPPADADRFPLGEHDQYLPQVVAVVEQCKPAVRDVSQKGVECREHNVLLVGDFLWGIAWAGRKCPFATNDDVSLNEAPPTNATMLRMVPRRCPGLVSRLDRAF
jgi:hypothetical protein